MAARAPQRDAELRDDADAATASRGLAVLGVVACIAAALFALALMWFKLASVDTGYHVAYGNVFLAERSIVARDPFLMPEHAVEFVNANWAAQIAMALAWNAGGANGLIALRIALLAVAFAGAAALLRSRGAAWRWVAWAWLLMAVGGYERFTMRPELFSYAVLACILALLARGVRSSAAVVALALLQVAWVNFHSYFLIGLISTGCFLAGEGFAWIAAPRESTERAEALSRARWLALALAAQVVACFVNPWHWHGAIFPLETLRYLREAGAMGTAAIHAKDSPWAAISEFHSPFSHTDIPANWRTLHAFWWMLGAAAVGILGFLRRKRIGMALVLAVLVLMSLQMRRNIALLALGGMPFAMLGISGLSPGGGALGKRLSSAFLAGAVALCAWWVPAIVDGRFYYVERRTTGHFGAGLNATMYRPDAVAWLAKQEARPESERPGPNLFVDFFASSNTLLWLPKRYRLFLDTNTFAYPEAVFALTLRLERAQLPPPPHPESANARLDQENVDVALLQCGADADPLVQQLASDPAAWALVYVDPHAVIFLRRTPRNAAIIAENATLEAKLDPRAWIDGLQGPALNRAMELTSACMVPLDLGWPAKAAALLEEACRLAPDYHEAWSNLGRCHGMLASDLHARRRPADEVNRELTLAIECSRKALSIEPSFRPAQLNLDLATKALNGRW